MKLATLSLLLVVFIDTLGQGLLFPIVNTLAMDPSQGFLPADTAQSTRHLVYGLVIGTFFVFWFFGAAYISRISDSIGRKRGIVICLVGALVGYALTIAALQLESLTLLLVGRAIAGFTAGNQPIAQAALVDISRDEAHRTRNMGYVTTALSAGLVAGPILGGLLSDPDVLGGLASLALPFYVTIVLIVLDLALVVVFFHDSRVERSPFRLEPAEILLTLWRAAQRPVVLRLSLVFFAFEFGVMAFYVFFDNYLSSRFAFDTLQTSLGMMVFGLVVALASSLLIAPLTERYRKARVIVACSILAIAASLLFVANPVALLDYVLIGVFGLAFGLGYPTLLSLFAASVDESEQGWVMGVTTALFTLAGGIVSLAGGELMALDIDLPFIVAVASFVVAGLLVTLFWRSEAMQSLDPR